MKLKIFLVLCITAFIGLSIVKAEPVKTRKYERPAKCDDGSTRCILKKFGKTTYWCVKSNLQRNLDSRRTTQPIAKTVKENMGHCKEIIPLHAVGEE